MRKYTFQDDRTEEEKKTLLHAVVATDKFMSGWGGAASGKSVAAWAYDPEEVSGEALFAWVAGRKEMKRVKHVSDVGRASIVPSGTAHFHIYTARPGHSAFNK